MFPNPLHPQLSPDFLHPEEKLPQTPQRELDTTHSPEPTLPSLSFPMTTVGTPPIPSAPSFELDLLSLFSLTAPFPIAAPFPFPTEPTVTADPALTDLAGEPDFLDPRSTPSSFSNLTPATLACAPMIGVGVDVRLLPLPTTAADGASTCGTTDPARADPARLPPAG
jgi:hypothetical protein